jgi:hypothetical protein
MKSIILLAELNGLSRYNAGCLKQKGFPCTWILAADQAQAGDTVLGVHDYHRLYFPIELGNYGIAFIDTLWLSSPEGWPIFPILRAAGITCYQLCPGLNEIVLSDGAALLISAEQFDLFVNQFLSGIYAQACEVTKKSG